MLMEEMDLSRYTHCESIPKDDHPGRPESGRTRSWSIPFFDEVVSCGKHLRQNKRKYFADPTGPPIARKTMEVDERALARKLFDEAFSSTLRELCW